MHLVKGHSNIDNQSNPLLFLQDSTNTNIKAVFLLEDDYTTGRAALAINVGESGVTNDRDLMLQKAGGKVGIRCTPTVSFEVSGSSKFNGSMDITGELNLTGNGAKYFDVDTLTNSNSLTLRHRSDTNTYETAATFVANGAASFTHNGSTRLATTSDGVDFGTGGANDILCISGQTLHRTGSNGCGLHFSSSVILPTNAAGTIGDQTCSLGNSSNRFNSLNVMQLIVYDRVASTLKPYDSATSYDLGSTSYRWRNVYAGGLIQNIFTTAATSTQAEFRNEHSVYGGGVRFKSNNTYGTVEIVNYNGTASASIYNSTGGWHWTGNWQTHGNVLPFQDSSHTLGTSSKRWSHIYGDAITSGSVDTTGNLTVTKSSPALNLNYPGTSIGNYPIINFDTNNAQGCSLYMTEFDSELPTPGMGLVVKRSASNTQPSSVTLSFSVLGEIYAGSQTLGSVYEVPHAGKSFVPSANNTYDLGSNNNRWRNVYTNDLNLSNEGGEGNDVDGTTGNYTIQEGESDLFLINKRNGKKYKFNLTEVA